ncbi:uncharacterized protein [Eurosta solidaginis]|uniref:uncharacterized protein n=1 Tax=Eurosta solidaginis TaxID=178769 RepID=UPI0035313272
MIEEEMPNIVLCAETHFTLNISESEINIVGYNHIRCDSHSRHTRGVLIYTHKAIECKVVYNNSINNNLWCIVIKTLNNTIKWQIGLVYHSPNSSDAEFIKYIGEILEEYFSENENNVIGDFNINVNLQSTYTNQLSHTFATTSMHQLINFNTRVTETSQTRIDLLYSNSDEIEIKNMENQRISDHETICFNLPVQKRHTMRIYEFRVFCNNYTKENLIALLRNYNFMEANDCDIGLKVQAINSILCDIMGMLTYEKRVQIKLVNKWYDRKLNELNKLKYELFKLAKNTNEWDNYNHTKRHYKKSIKIKRNNLWKIK